MPKGRPKVGIPGAFIIDRQGKLAWVGRIPTVRSYTFDQALEDTLADKTDLRRARAVQSCMAKDAGESPGCAGK
jgi:glyceraldehyde-3-phosphate dehydrogenase/erythrose-4-phosphate dehydrogenase